ncbi:hypothetical protein PT277_10230 [Acetobacteraceae bacterium ESL0709]|nr:hypothetical protein [Acetobacteraceae bacterium ESL0697]MDF7679058.1 hypothetical protein [Acetobacteraceae bacterium ESL0709]
MISFIDQMEDFGLSAQKDEKKEKEPLHELTEHVQEEEPVPVDTSIHIQPEDLEALKKQAFEEGYQKGREEIHATLLLQMTESLEGVFSFLEKEETQRRDITKQFVQKMAETVYGVMKNHFLREDTIQRDFTQEIVSVAEDCAGLVSSGIVISCSESEQDGFRKAFFEKKGIIIESDPERKLGSVVLKSSQNEAMLDHSAWRKAVQERIISAINSIVTHSRQDKRQEN